MKTVVRLLLVLIVALAAWLLLAPTRVEPVAWNPQPAPSLSEGPYAGNDRLKDIERIAHIDAKGPEAINTDASGRLYTGYADGRIARFAADGGDYHLLANTGGRPLSVVPRTDGSLIVVDAIKGLLRIDAQGTIETLSTSADGQAFGFPDYGVLDAAGQFVYFSDASSKWGYGRHQFDALEHAGRGRLLRYDFATKQTTVLLRGLQFANGVSMGPDDAYLLVNESASYRITRYWLKGDKAGTSDVFVDNLPGFPDNISFNGRDRFWVALFAPRDPLLDKLAGNVFARKMVARAMALLPLPLNKRAMAMAYDTDGHVVANLQYDGADAYAPMTHVAEVGDWLYFGSIEEAAIGRMPLAKALAAASAAPILRNR